MIALAGKYAKPLAAGLAGAAALGAGGSLLGNMIDNEQGEGPARLATEAVMAGVNALPAGLMAGSIPFMRGAAKRQAIDAIRSRSASAPQAKEIARNITGQMLRSSAVQLPIQAGIGGLIGGGISNVLQSAGLSGFQAGSDPEAYGSSNSPGAIYKTPTTQYV